MHLMLLLATLAIAWGIRFTGSTAHGSWIDRWQQALGLFLLPPLLLMTSAIAVCWMGPHGQMVWPWEGWLSYGLGLSFLGFAALQCLHLAWQGSRTLRQVRTQPITEHQSNPIRVLESPILYSAQIGFWRPELVISRGLLETLAAPHLEAVIAHEQAHRHYRDTFCFFWLGWIRHFTTWLPQTELLWQELLVLRELRADRWAAEQTDPLCLAEALLLVVEQYPLFGDNVCAAFSSTVTQNRLTQRIEALLVALEPIEPDALNRRSWGTLSWMLLSVLPLLLIPFHR
ncbi:MAG: M56 family metallopeptidase [Thermosynechococcaceae cyanobacterium MS004]|nr:M56 family metallopeptidase [Thermosynechococcaceae cyanobacterium MS004]